MRHRNFALVDLFLAEVPKLRLQALEQAVKAYAGRKAGQAGKEAIVGHRFARGNPHGWAPLSPPYAKWKRKQFGAKPILVRTGRLKQATIANGRVSVTGPAAVSVVFAGLPDYAKHHHEGGKRLPLRSPVDPSPTDLAAMVKVASRDFDRLVRASMAKIGLRPGRR